MFYHNIYVIQLDLNRWNASLQLTLELKKSPHKAQFERVEFTGLMARINPGKKAQLLSDLNCVRTSRYICRRNCIDSVNLGNLSIYATFFVPFFLQR